MVKIAITVEGGVVSAVYADSPDVEVDILDFDNLEEQNKEDQADMVAYPYQVY